MTEWDVLDRLIGSFPPLAMTLLLLAVLAAAVIFIVGFSRHGSSFLKYGFKQTAVLGSAFEKRFDRLEAKFDTLHTHVDTLRTKVDTLHTHFDTLREDVDAMRFELTAIKTNHFGHLKGFLSELAGILQDKSIINNAEKARLDNQLRDM